jgi:hypothetical protein
MFRGFLQPHQIPVAAALWDRGCDFPQCLQGAQRFASVAQAVQWVEQGNPASGH